MLRPDVVARRRRHDVIPELAPESEPDDLGRSGAEVAVGEGVLRLGVHLDVEHGSEVHVEPEHPQALGRDLAVTRRQAGDYPYQRATKHARALLDSIDSGAPPPDSRLRSLAPDLSLAPLLEP